MFGLFALFTLFQPVPPPVQEEVVSVFQQLVSFVAANGVLSFSAIFVILAYAITLIATITPNESDNKIADFLWQVINLFGGNFGNAKNK